MKLKELRIKNKLTQQETADFLNIAKTTYNGYETEKHNPTPDIILKLSDLFRCSTDELLGKIPQQNLFDNSRIPKTQIQTLFDQLNIVEQGKAIGYIESMLETRGVNIDLEIK